MIDICYLDDKKAFDFLNQAFAAHMDHRAKAGLLMRGNVEIEIRDFACISNAIRAVFMNKKALIKMQSRYEGLQFDINKLIKENEEADCDENQLQREHNYNTETLTE